MNGLGSGEGSRSDSGKAADEEEEEAADSSDEGTTGAAATFTPPARARQQHIAYSDRQHSRRRKADDSSMTGTQWSSSEQQQLIEWCQQVSSGDGVVGGERVGWCEEDNGYGAGQRVTAAARRIEVASAPLHQPSHRSRPHHCTQHTRGAHNHTVPVPGTCNEHISRFT